MAKERQGLVQIKNGKIYARVSYTDERGKRHHLMRRAENKTEAKQIIKKLLRDLEDHGDKLISAEQMTFNDLANYFTEHYLKPAEYVQDRKIAGMRSFDKAKSHFHPVRDYFGTKRLRSITYGDIAKYRAMRLKTPTIQNKQRSIATVNRELSLLRRVLGVAQREGWITKNPFSSGDPLISVADEKKRERILSKEEEQRLLDACIGHRAHLKAIIICALDTGMRQGEIFSLKWKNINFDEQVVTIEAFNTKTMKERQVFMTSRLKRELLNLYSLSIRDLDDLVFGIQDNCKKAFNSARKISGLSDLRFHDLRHTAATRLIQQNIPLQEVGRILGHTQANTTYRYVNANIDTARRAALALDNFNEMVGVIEEERIN
jgi:integrase